MVLPKCGVKVITTTIFSYIYNQKELKPQSHLARTSAIPFPLAEILQTNLNKLNTKTTTKFI